MNQRIQQAYDKRPKDWVYNLITAVIVVGLLIWSGSAVETSGSTQDGGQIALNVLSEDRLPLTFCPESSILILAFYSTFQQREFLT